MPRVKNPDRPPRKRLKKWTPVVVTWLDAVTVREEMHSEDDIDDAKPVIRKSIGFLLKSNRSEVIICMEDDREKEDSHSDCQTVTGIPRGMVTDIQPLVPIEETSTLEKDSKEQDVPA